jgi:hypothetical protein
MRDPRPLPRRACCKFTFFNLKGNITKASYPVHAFRTMEKPMSRLAPFPLIVLLVLAACSKPVSNPRSRRSRDPGRAGRVGKNPAGRCAVLHLHHDGLTTLTISLRPGLGRTTVDTWAAGKMPVSVTNVSGVGERAVWQSTLKEINAEKNDLLCDIGVVGPAPARARHRRN